MKLTKLQRYFISNMSMIILIIFGFLIKFDVYTTIRLNITCCILFDISLISMSFYGYKYYKKYIKINKNVDTAYIECLFSYIPGIFLIFSLICLYSILLSDFYIDCAFVISRLYLFYIICSLICCITINDIIYWTKTLNSSNRI